MMRNSKKAEMGVATLVLFIAIILVVAVAFQVILKTTQQVSETSRDAGKQVMQNVGTAIGIEQGYAEDGTNGNLDYFYIVVKQPAGSNDVLFSEAILKMSLNTAGQEYIFNGSVDCASKSASSSTSIYNATNVNYYGVRFKLNTESAANKTYIKAGDVVELCFKSPVSVTTNTTKFRVSYTPTKGNGWTIKDPEWNTINTKTYYFFP
jgi:archaellin